MLLTSTWLLVSRIERAIARISESLQLATHFQAENTLEFSLEDSKRAEPVLEAYLEFVWSVVVCKLVKGSLLKKTDSFPLYQGSDAFYSFHIDLAFFYCI